MGVSFNTGKVNLNNKDVSLEVKIQDSSNVTIDFSTNAQSNQFVSDNNISEEELNKILKLYPDFLNATQAEQEKIYEAYAQSLMQTETVPAEELPEEASAPAAEDDNTIVQGKYSDLADKFLTKEQNQAVLDEIFEHTKMSRKKWNGLSDEKRAAIYTKQIMEMAIRDEFGIDEKTWHKGLSNEERKEYANKFIDKLVYESPDENGNIIGEDAWNNLSTNEQDKYRADLVEKISKISNRPISELPQNLQDMHTFYYFKSKMFDENGNNVLAKQKGFQDLTSFLRDEYPGLRINSEGDKRAVLFELIRKGTKDLSPAEVKNFYMSIAYHAKDTQELDLINEVFAQKAKLARGQYAAANETADRAIQESVYRAAGTVQAENVDAETLQVHNEELTRAAAKGDETASQSISNIAITAIDVTDPSKVSVLTDLVDNAAKLGTEEFQDEYTRKLTEAKNEEVRAGLASGVLKKDSNFAVANQAKVAETVPQTLSGENLEMVRDAIIATEKQEVIQAGASVASKINKEDQNSYHEAFWNTNNEAVQNILTNQLGDFHKDNQKAIYERTMTSQYDSVLQTGANNIYKLDDSVKDYAVNLTKSLGKENVTNSIRTEAPQVSTKSVDSVNLQQTQAVQSMPISNKADATKMDATTKSLVNEITQASTDNTKAKEFVEKFSKAKIDEQVSMIDSLPAVYKKTAITMVCRFNSLLLGQFILQGRGPELLSMGLPLDVQNKIIDLMFKSGDSKTLNEACAFVKKHPKSYPVYYAMAMKRENGENKHIEPPKFSIKG